ncbi:pilus assembly protein TadG-related protein [Antarctobacter jejuensis]|uniref:pilus assembly protein TadG-related protein n=1 Tax=Antarctobacter jejuensis TaxID=1439938 RepID=UPI003FD1F18A
MLKNTTILAGLPALRNVPALSGAVCRASEFWSDQSGNMSYLAIVGSLVMMVFGGVGVDMMHAELKRNKVQNTLDRAVLAAANIENTQDPDQVVRDYLTAMGMGDALTSVEIEQSLTSKSVTARGEATISSDFMSLIGVNTLDASGLATAVHASANNEISLILDVSGSMGWNGKIGNLRVAANEFVDILLPEGASGSLTTISIVPYNASVNMGTQLPEYFAMNRLHSYSNCAVFPQSAFGNSGIDPTSPLEQQGQFDPYSTSTLPGDTPRQWCRDGNNAAILPHSADRVQLKAHIDSLEAWGNTAIDVGMKWGTALLDPETRAVTEGLVDDGLVDAVHITRPASYADPETSKFIVVMTDGENTTQYDLPASLKNPGSGTGVWVNTKGTETYADDDYSVRLDTFDSPVTDYFPPWAQDISNIVVYFDTNGDGVHDVAHKIEGFPDNGPRDVDDFITGTVGYMIAADASLTDSAQFMGVSIKGGVQTTSYFAVKDDLNGPLPDTGPTTNTGPIPGTTYQYNTFDFTTYASTGGDVSMYYWTRFSGDPAERYQSTVDGLGTNPAFVMELNHNDLFDRFGTRAAADLLFEQAELDGYISSGTYNLIRSPYGVVAGPNAADNRLEAICDAAKDQGIVVFAIGFEAPQRGLDAMANCASSPAHFFDVQGADLEDTFASIANTITQLRLTQ